MAIRRRQLGLGVAALATALSSSIARAGDARAGKRILLIGSSLMRGALGMYMADALEAKGHRVHRHAKSASGISRPDFYDWNATAKKLYAEFRPDATVAMFGANDAQGLWMGEDRKPKWIRWHEPGWGREYERRTDRLIDLLTPRAERVIWMGALVVRPPKLRGRIAKLNRLYRNVVSARPNVTYVDTWELMSDRRGEYAEFLAVRGKRRQVREPDGVHVTGAGATRLVDMVAPTIDRVVREPLPRRISVDERDCTAPHPPR